jgi:prepilin peptidase CpaA
MALFVHALLLSIGLMALIVAAAVDVKLRLIPNPVVLAIACCGLGLRMLNGLGGALESLAIAVVVFIPLGLLAGRKLLGGGDAKMMAAVTLLVAPTSIPRVFLTIALVGGALALVYVASGYRTAHARTASAPTGSTSAPNSLPYGVAIAVGVAIVLLRGGFGCSSGTFC